MTTGHVRWTLPLEDFEALTSRYEGDEITGYRLDKAIYSLDPEDGEVLINV